MYAEVYIHMHKHTSNIIQNWFIHILYKHRKLLYDCNTNNLPSLHGNFGPESKHLLKWKIRARTGSCFFFLSFFWFSLTSLSILFHSYRDEPISRWGETGVPRENHLTHPQAELDLSHMWHVGLEPTPATVVRWLNDKGR